MSDVAKTLRLIVRLRKQLEGAVELQKEMLVHLGLTQNAMPLGNGDGTVDDETWRAFQMAHQCLSNLRPFGGKAEGLALAQIARLEDERVKDRWG